MQFCLLYIDKDGARLSCFESLLPHRRGITDAESSLKLIWTDTSFSPVEAGLSEEPEIVKKTNPNFLIELLTKNSNRITDPLLVCLSVSIAESYDLSFPFSDIKKIKQVYFIGRFIVLCFHI